MSIYLLSNYENVQKQRNRLIQEWWGFPLTWTIKIWNGIIEVDTSFSNKLNYTVESNVYLWTVTRVRTSANDWELFTHRIDKSTKSITYQKYFISWVDWYSDFYYDSATDWLYINYSFSSIDRYRKLDLLTATLWSENIWAWTTWVIAWNTAIEFIWKNRNCWTSDETWWWFDYVFPQIIASDI